MNQLINLINHYSPIQVPSVPNFIPTVTSTNSRTALMRGTQNILFRVTYCETCHKNPLWIFWYHGSGVLKYIKIESKTQEIYVYDFSDQFIPHHYLCCNEGCKNSFILQYHLKWSEDYQGYIVNNE